MPSAHYDERVPPESTAGIRPSPLAGRVGRGRATSLPARGEGREGPGYIPPRVAGRVGRGWATSLPARGEGREGTLVYVPPRVGRFYDLSRPERSLNRRRAT